MQRIGWTASAAVLVLVGASVSHGQETVLLGGTGDATVHNLLFDGQAETEPVFYRGWGGVRWGGWGRGWGGWGGRGWGWGGWGWRGWGWGGWGRVGFWRPWVARPWIARPWVVRPWGFWGAGFGPSFGSAPYFYSSSPGVYDCSASAYGYPDYDAYSVDNSVVTSNAVVLGSSSYVRPPIFPTPPKSPTTNARVSAPVAPKKHDGTYFYDGGPAHPTPLPGQDSGPGIEKRPTVPLDGRLVSIPSQPARYAYPAYGETAPAPAPPRPTPLKIASNPTAQTTPISYPAYGDRRD
jgi:hypothetical protein